MIFKDDVMTIESCDIIDFLCTLYAITECVCFLWFTGFGSRWRVLRQALLNNYSMTDRDE